MEMPLINISTKNTIHIYGINEYLSSRTTLSIVICKTTGYTTVIPVTNNRNNKDKYKYFRYGQSYSFNLLNVSKPAPPLMICFNVTPNITVSEINCYPLAPFF